MLKKIVHSFRQNSPKLFTFHLALFFTLLSCLLVMSKPPVVLDNGTGYTKMGYAGNYEPNHLVPSLISVAAKPPPGMKAEDYIFDLDFYIGAEATQKRANYNVDYPIRHGVIDNWDNMEKYWQRCIYEYMCCDPEEHHMLLVKNCSPFLQVQCDIYFAFAADGASNEHTRES